MLWKDNGSWGGALNATGWARTQSPGSGKGDFRSNVNIGYYF